VSTLVDVERAGPVAVITICRPDKRNAVDPEVSAAMNAAFADAEADDEIAVSVLTGSGDVFCAGADLAAIAAGRVAEIVELEPGGFGGLVRLTRRKPVIAAVNGHALAGGFELVLAADLAVAAEEAEFGLPEVGHGIIPSSGGLVRLPRQVPPKVALEVVLTGDRLTAARALELGLVNCVVPRAEVLPEALALAGRIAQLPPGAVHAARRVTEVAAGEGAEAAWRENDDAWAALLASGTGLAGPRAFVERRAQGRGASSG
jgi:enoyl-CoA hydratase/carnithine racemase